MVRTIVLAVIEVYIVALIARALVSWFPPPMHGSPFYKVIRLLDDVTEPVLAPVRRVLPPVRLGGMGLDLSIIVVLLALQLIVVPIVVRIL
jgi:YggT family protein